MRQHPARLDHRLGLAHDQLALPFADADEARAAEAAGPGGARIKCEIDMRIRSRALEHLLVAPERLGRRPDLRTLPTVAEFFHGGRDLRGVELLPKFAALIVVDDEEVAHFLDLGMDITIKHK